MVDHYLSCMQRFRHYLQAWKRKRRKRKKKKKTPKQNQNQKHRRLTGENDNKSTQFTCLLELHREERQAAMFSRRLVAILVYLYAFMTIIELLPYLQSTIFCLLLFVLHLSCSFQCLNEQKSCFWPVWCAFCHLTWMELITCGIEVSQHNYVGKIVMHCLFVALILVFRLDESNNNDPK